MTNCYLVQDEKSGKSLLVDPGFYSPELDVFLERNGVSELDYILVTHGHTDHTCGVSYVKEKYGGKIVVGEKDAYLLSDNGFLLGERSYVEAFRPCEADIIVKDGDTLSFSDEKIEILHTPGHTEGEVCYIISDKLFTGDVLFMGSMGRTDLPGGNLFKLFHSLRRLYELEKDYIVLPGHGEKTTLGYEKKTNRYLITAGNRK